MRMWRPCEKCIYLIPEIHGNASSLELILNRVLPLRKFKGQEDIIIFLGDYIDGDENSKDVLNILINIKNEYKDRAIFLRGNHDDLMLKAINGDDGDFSTWIDAGGISTIKSYTDASPYSIPRTRLNDIIPKEHIEFLKSLDPYRIIDKYVFMHGGFNIDKSISENSEMSFVYDYIASKKVKDAWKNNSIIEFKDDYIFVGAHNYNGDEPFLSQRYFMLGGSAPSRLMIFELNSMKASAIRRNKSRMYNYPFKVV
jgi:predicted MPP superfamily phosphohydrolase